MTKMRITSVFLAILLASTLASSIARADAIDAVIATVDEQPILLSDLNKLLPKPITVSQATNDPSARAALDRLIFESLVNSEAETRRLTVSDSDIERYVDEVATRNGLSREGFIEALKAQGKDWNTYHSQVKLDILQTRLASIMLQGMSTVKEEELTRYFEEHPGVLQQGASVTLRRLVTAAKESAETYANKELSSDDFAQIVREHSVASDASEGGLLGRVAERDLAPDIFNALMNTEAGHSSAVVFDSAANTYTVYYVIARSKGSDEDLKIVKEQVKQKLSQAKLAQSMEGMFQTELFKNHTIDKKI